MTLPEPVLKWRESVNHSVLHFPELKLDPTIQLHIDDDKKESLTCTLPNLYLLNCDLNVITANSLDPRPASPPPAYVRSSHSERNDL